MLQRKFVLFETEKILMVISPATRAVSDWWDKNYYHINYNSRESSESTHICIIPSRYNLAYSSGLSMASVFNAHCDPGVVFKIRLPNNQYGAYSWRRDICRYCCGVYCILYK